MKYTLYSPTGSIPDLEAAEKDGLVLVDGGSPELPAEWNVFAASPSEARKIISKYGVKEPGPDEHPFAGRYGLFKQAAYDSRDCWGPMCSGCQYPDCATKPCVECCRV